MDLPDLFPANPMQLRTIRHYNFSEVSSAMQKAIRRGDAALAGYWALELWSSGFGKYVWKRLLTISAEDCWGILTQEVKALHDSYLVINEALRYAGWVKADGIWRSRRPAIQ
jgi:replication-associated recombination protein RarA